MKAKKLAQISVVHGITNFLPSKNICVAHILSKQVVMRSVDVKLGDKVVLIKENSLLPEASWNLFMGRERRVRPHRFLKHRSDCLALPISNFPELNSLDPENKSLEVGADVTGLLNIKLWNPKRKKVSN